jgi:hypothetical protein
MKFCCRTTHEIATNVLAIHFALGGQFLSNGFWDETVGMEVRAHYALVSALHCFGNVGLSILLVCGM